MENIKMKSVLYGVKMTLIYAVSAVLSIVAIQLIVTI